MRRWSRATRTALGSCLPLFLALFAAIPNSHAAALTCQGKRATITGSSKDDRITGTDANDVIVAQGGDDTILAGNGNDRVCAGPGSDSIEGGTGSNRLDGGEGVDQLTYKLGEMWVDLGSSSTPGFAQGGSLDRLYSIENLRTADDANDVVVGGPGPNRIDLGTGFDTYIWFPNDTGDDTIDGGGDGDQLVYGASPGPVSVDLAARTASGGPLGRDTISGFEVVFGSFFDDVLMGDEGDNVFHGSLAQSDAFGLSLGGDDEMSGGAGNDQFFGSIGDDVVDGGAGNDDFQDYAFSSDVYDAGPGDDGANFSRNIQEYRPEDSGTDTVRLGSGNDGASGAAGNDQFFGEDGNDYIQAGSGDDLLDGGSGSDFLQGGYGHDTCVNYEYAYPNEPHGCDTAENPDPAVEGGPTAAAPRGDLSVSVLGPPRIAKGIATWRFRADNAGPTPARATIAAFLPAAWKGDSLVGTTQQCRIRLLAGLGSALRLVTCEVEMASGASVEWKIETASEFGVGEGLVAVFETTQTTGFMDVDVSNNVSTLSGTGSTCSARAAIAARAMEQTEPCRTVNLQAPSFVERGEPFDLSVTITPCEGRQNDDVDLLRRAGEVFGRLSTKATADDCTADFRTHLRNTTEFKARLPAKGSEPETLSTIATVTVK